MPTLQLVNHKQMRRLLEAARRDRAPQRFYNDLRDALEKKELLPGEFSIRQLFEEFVPQGRELVESFNPRCTGGNDIALLEAAGAVSTSDFSNITGQIVSARVLDALESPQFLWDQLCEVIPTAFNGERIPGIGRIGDEAAAIAEGESYPLAGVSEEYIETPATTKRGFIVPVTREAVFFDRTGLLLSRCAEVAEFLGVNREKRVLDCVFGVTNTYNRNGTAYNTYQASTPWINVQATNALVDWTDVENAELLFDAMTDPNTGEPLAVMPDTILVPTALKHTARRIVSSTEIRYGDGASQTTQTVSVNPLGNQYRILSSPYIKSRTGSASTWFLGQPKKAFAYMQNWGATVVQAPDNSEAEFTQDVVARFKVSERGTPAVLEPRRMVKCTA